MNEKDSPEVNGRSKFRFGVNSVFLLKRDPVRFIQWILKYLA